LGRLVPEKGIHYLIEAFRNVKTDKKLVIAGGSSDTTEYMDSLKEIAGDNVIFTGFQQGKILEELYSNAYIYCLPSDLEGMPLSLLEAMSYGNCCLTSDISECAEVVEDKAVTFEKANTKELKNQLQRLCDDQILVKKYKEEAADFICKKYSWNEVMEQTLKLYRGEKWQYESVAG
jgi:glycosyltransferase involved in cell wall biosynthesis